MIVITKEEYKRLQTRSHKELTKLINYGFLSKLNESILCVDCSSIAKVYDHRDYRKPMSVEPVCRACNTKRGSALPKFEGQSAKKITIKKAAKTFLFPMKKLKRWIYKNGGAKEAASQFKCSKTMVYRMMSGEKKPGVELAIRIKRKTGINLSILRPDIWNVKS